MSAMELSEWEGKLNEEVRIDCTLEALAPGQLIDCAGGEEKGNATRVDDEVTVINVECEEVSDGKQANYYRLASWCGVIAGASTRCGSDDLTLIVQENGEAVRLMRS